MADREQRVTPLELFFDLVFVYALTQVTTLMSRDLTWQGVCRGLLVLAALWWAASPAACVLSLYERSGPDSKRPHASATVILPLAGST